MLIVKNFKGGYNHGSTEEWGNLIPIIDNREVSIPVAPKKYPVSVGDNEHSVIGT